MDENALPPRPTRVVQVLQKALELFKEDGSGWVTHNWGVGEDGNEIGDGGHRAAMSPKAVAFCSIGGLTGARMRLGQGYGKKETGRPNKILARAMGRVDSDVDGYIMKYNDTSVVFYDERTGFVSTNKEGGFQKIKAAFEKAIKMAVDECKAKTADMAEDEAKKQVDPL